MDTVETPVDNKPPSIIKKNVDGIILVLSCQKHRDTRLKEFSFSKTNYNNWEVIYVIGDLFLSKNYILEGNILHVRCEDSYLHLLKKLAVAMKSVKELFNIKEGILRCGDDLIFNENNLIKFIKSKKFDYWGQCFFKKTSIPCNIAHALSAVAPLMRESVFTQGSFCLSSQIFRVNCARLANSRDLTCS
jgi:hypothetical protein